MVLIQSRKAPIAELDEAITPGCETVCALSMSNLTDVLASLPKHLTIVYKVYLSIVGVVQRMSTSPLEGLKRAPLPCSIVVIAHELQG